MRDINEGIVKSCIFGVACSLIAVYEGYNADADGGGRRARDDAHGGDLGGGRAVLGLSAHRSVFVRGIAMRKSSTLNLGAGTFVLLGFAALAFLDHPDHQPRAALGSAGTYDVTAKFDNIGDLKVGAPVSMAGVEIGRVARIDLDTKEYKAVVLMRLELQVQPDSDRQRCEHLHSRTCWAASSSA